MNLTTENPFAKTQIVALSAKAFLTEYAKENNVSDICELLDKDTLIENSRDVEWIWAIEDEMRVYGCSEKEALERVREWYYAMSNNELFYKRNSTYSQDCLMIEKAKALGFDYKAEVE